MFSDSSLIVFYAFAIKQPAKISKTPPKHPQNYAQKLTVVEIFSIFSKYWFVNFGFPAV